MVRIDSVEYEIGDAFDDSRSYSKYDRMAYDFLNIFHIKTQEITARKLLLFNQGDYVDSELLLESERFLRDQKFLSDASISVRNEGDKHIATVKTSDNWTLSIPASFAFSGSEFSYDNLTWGLGLQESNFLGLGKKLGFYYGHDEFRDTWSVGYGDPHFLFRFNQLDVVYSYNSDGYLASWQMLVPYLSRSKNQWAYTLAGLKNKRDVYFYGSGDLAPGAVPTISKNRPVDSLPLYNGDNGDKISPIMRVNGFIEDSLSFRFSRSFGGTKRKVYLAATYDYYNASTEDSEVLRYLFNYQGNSYAIDTNALNRWMPERKDSRLGGYIMYSNLRYEKIRNFHSVKWTEDIDKGWTLKVGASKNVENLGSDNNDFRFDILSNMYLGQFMHHLTLNSRMHFYVDHSHIRDFYGWLQGEYLLHWNNSFSSVLNGLMDFYDNANYGYQLSLGGSDGFVGFPTGFYTGQARVYGKLEQRWFPNVEFATLMPVVVVFGSVGETAWNFKDICRKDLIYVAGFGLRFAQTKSISRIINNLDVSFPINGERKREAHYSITTGFSL